eukprot:jgi/Picre1/30848/NNA_006207.t1
MHFIERRAKRKSEFLPSTTQAVLLQEEVAAAIDERAHESEAAHKQDVEAQRSSKEMEHVAPLPPSMSSSRTVMTGCESPRKVVLSEHDPEEETEKEAESAKNESERTSRTAPDVMQVIENDPHNHALHKMGLLTALAIFIHNFPEGLATFVATLSDTSIGIGIAIAIAVHNIPEGICVALPIYYSTGSRKKAFFWATASGMSEPLGAVVGYLALYGDTSLAFAIVFALVAGMMVYISIKELIPMALRYDPKDKWSTNCVVLGMAVMAASLLLFTL